MLSTHFHWSTSPAQRLTVRITNRTLTRVDVSSQDHAPLHFSQTTARKYTWKKKKQGSGSGGSSSIKFARLLSIAIGHAGLHYLTVDTLSNNIPGQIFCMDSKYSGQLDSKYSGQIFWTANTLDSKYSGQQIFWTATFQCLLKYQCWRKLFYGEIILVCL